MPRRPGSQSDRMGIRALNDWLFWTHCTRPLSLTTLEHRSRVSSTNRRALA